MAKSPAKTDGTSRIRFIMLDAEIPSGDIQQVTQAIQNALRPTTIIQQRVVAPSLPSLGGLEADGADPVMIDLDANGDDGDDAERAGQTPSTKRQSSPAKPRAYRTPQVLEIDLTSAVSWEDFWSVRKPESDADRFLTVAAWFKECRAEPAISVDHVYTCYRAAKWPTAIDDFSAPLRHLKHRQLMGSGGRGLYSINHLGLAKVEELTRG